MPLAASANRMQRPVSGLHPTPLPTSHCSLAVQAAPMGPGSGTMQVEVDVPFGQTVPALQAPRTHGLPAAVGAAQTPQAASGARAQKALSHWRSSRQVAPVRKLPGRGAQAVPRSPRANAVQGWEASESAQLEVSAGVALDPGVNRVRQSSCSRASQVARLPNTRLVANGAQS